MFGEKSQNQGWLVVGQRWWELPLLQAQKAMHQTHWQLERFVRLQKDLLKQGQLHLFQKLQGLQTLRQILPRQVSGC
jgi:hypothetical protein